MPDIAIRDILINARQESFRMQHFYLGVEHLFIGLLEVPGGIATSLLESRGLTASYVIDSIRRQTGKGTRQRLWAGMPNTPRADIVLSIANDLALEDGRVEIGERDLLKAILEERDNIPVRVLSRLHIDLDAFAADIDGYVDDNASHQFVLPIEIGESFSDIDSVTDEHRLILRRMFRGYERIRLESRLYGGYTQALVLLVTPISADDMEDAPVVVKIDQSDIILDEANRYDQYVRTSLPALTARLVESPTTAETSRLAGLKYTFVSEYRPHQTGGGIQSWQLGTTPLGQWIENSLFPSFGRTWWNQRRPFRFQMWSEYDWLLPPLLTIEFSEQLPDDAYTIRDPIRRNKLRALSSGDFVKIEDFTVMRVYRDRNVIQIAVGKGSEAARRAYTIEVRGLNLAQDAYYRSEIVESIGGRIINTRDLALFNAVEKLEPDFGMLSALIPGWERDHTLPNPLRHYDELLDRPISGSVSKIHGDLHLGNILVGINQSPFLIDFSHTRNGHTLFDWATLEVSVLSEIVSGAVGSDWDAVRYTLRALSAVHHLEALDDLPVSILNVLEPVIAIQRVVHQCLATPGQREEFDAALAFCALRAVTWDTLSIGARRLAFGVVALCLSELHESQRSGSGGDTPSHDVTDLI
ncbi:hypothetical protein FBR02_06600 [Anaerolineae bacterium CFX9]|nr:hypothetical protein [Anaerolineae bacterium CFX9]